MPACIPINTTKISNLPKSIPIISIIKMIFDAVGEVIPIDNHTVPNAEANSNIALCKSQLAKKDNNPVPKINNIK